MHYYSKDVIHELDNISRLSYFNEWYQIVKDILLSDEFQRRKLFKHHDNSVWDHSINVSFRSFLMAKYYNLDEKTCAIAGLLHDFYPKAYKKCPELEKLNPNYMSRVIGKLSFKELYGFVHAKEAANNALKYYPKLVDDKIYSCIKTHMFPLNIIPPRYPEGWIITLMDKKLSASTIKEIKYIPGIIKAKVTSNHLK